MNSILPPFSAFFDPLTVRLKDLACDRWRGAAGGSDGHKLSRSGPVTMRKAKGNLSKPGIEATALTAPILPILPLLAPFLLPFSLFNPAVGFFK